MSIFGTLSLAVRICRYFVMASNRHDLQAPFAYSLNEEVFRRDCKEPVQEQIETVRRKLLRDHSKIKVRDFGAGFGGVIYKERTISFITRNSAKPPRYARMLYRLVRHLKPKVMLELGTSVGLSALYQALGNPDGHMITLEGCPETAAIARANFKEFPSLNIEIVEGSFEESLPALFEKLDQIDYLFIDGHHRLEPTLNYIRLCYPRLSPHAVVVIDDINWSSEMRETWELLKSDPRFTLGIDVFMMGLLFVSKDFSKENFILRY